MNVYADAKLTQTEAEVRAQQIRQVDYELHFVLPESEPNFYGRVRASLDVTQDAAQLSETIFMDFSGAGAVVKGLKLNAKQVDYRYDGSKIFLSSTLFRVGANELFIEFEHSYGGSGTGFHRTRDESDGKYYVYSHFEPYHANTAFPCFDQPDLKATFQLTVDVPFHWTVIANTRELDIQGSVGEEEGKKKTWYFPTSERFSTYLFALVAGPYHKWDCEVNAQVPMRLFARESMAQYLSKDVNAWFQITDAGLKFYEKAFGFRFPFKKYDQVLTPDYTIGAMENVAAVTFSENHIFRTPVTPIRALNRAETILHELAHVWFGNLVTPTWWNDLWLKESFATYISNLAISRCSEVIQETVGPVDVWQEFHLRSKEWAYEEDDVVTTHPIVGEARDTDEATANFDGITYGKGAAVLKQLVHYLGEDVFLVGLKSYFKKFAFGNATRLGFLRELSQASGDSSGKDLETWDLEWMRTSGTNSVQVLLNARDGLIESLVLRQLPDEAGQRLRTHRTELGLYDQNPSGEVELRETLSVTYSGNETQVSGAVGKRIPVFVFPNEGDQDYVHVVLSKADVSFLESSLIRIPNPHVRQMLWSSLWSQVSHAKLPAQKFAKIAMQNLAQERDLSTAQHGLGYLVKVPLYLCKDLKAECYQQVEDFILKLFETSSSGSAMQIALFNRYLQVAHSAEALLKLRAWLNQSEVFSGFKMDQDRRWSVLCRYSNQAGASQDEVKSIIDAELKKDINDKGAVSAMVAAAAYPDPMNKQLWWRRLLEKDESYPQLSLEKARRVLAVFHNEDRPELTEFVGEQIFELLPQMTKQFSQKFNASFIANLYSVECGEKYNHVLDAFLKNNPDLTVGVTRELLRARQNHERIQKARVLSALSASSSVETPE